MGKRLTKPPDIPYSYVIVSASEKGHAFGDKYGHKSGSVSLPKFSSGLRKREIIYRPLREAIG